MAGCCDEVELVAWEPGPSSVESRRHQEFRDYWVKTQRDGLRLRGREWFRLEGAVVDHIRKLRADKPWLDGELKASWPKDDWVQFPVKRVVYDPASTAKQAASWVDVASHVEQAMNRLRLGSVVGFASSEMVDAYASAPHMFMMDGTEGVSGQRVTASWLLSAKSPAESIAMFSLAFMRMMGNERRSDALRWLDAQAEKILKGQDTEPWHFAARRVLPEDRGPDGGWLPKSHNDLIARVHEHWTELTRRYVVLEVLNPKDWE